MTFEIRPSLPEAEGVAVMGVLAGRGILAGARPSAYESAWRRAGVDDAVEDERVRGAELYATRSPRRTRGATRA